MEGVSGRSDIDILNDTIDVGCLRALYRAAEGLPNSRVHVFLTDDGSTDGTAEGVRELGGEVTILRGSGDLFWNRGMVRAWEAAAGTTSDFDDYLLLNDDTLVDGDALRRLIDTSSRFDHHAIVAGATRDPVTGNHTYGGVCRRSPWHPGRTASVPISDCVQDVDTFNANCVIVPRYVYERIGTLDPVFHHGIGDFDYGLRARAAGLKVVVAPGTVGACARNEVADTWRDSKLPLGKRLRLLNSPKGLPRSEWRVYLGRHGAPVPWLMAWLPTLQVAKSWFLRSLKAIWL